MGRQSIICILLFLHTSNTAWESIAQNQPKYSANLPSLFFTPSQSRARRTPQTDLEYPLTPITMNQILPDERLLPLLAQKGCLFGDKRCRTQCTARGYTRAVCRSYTCSCLKDAVKLPREIRLCSASCPKKCAIKSRQLRGVCDENEFCYCYDRNARLDIKQGKCYIPEIICRDKCVNSGFSISNCVDEFCVCSNSRRKYKAYNYKTGSCVVPKKYCQKRCAGAKFPKGVCFNDRCICMMHGDPNKDFFVIDVGKDDADCDPCKRRCRMKAFSGRCIANECVCTSGEDYEVLGNHNQGPRCSLPKDYCTFACANNKFYRRADCSGYSCKCYVGKKSKVLDFQKGSCLFPKNQCQELCKSSRHQFMNGFCNGAHCLCMYPTVWNDLPAFSGSAFLCEKYPRAPYTSICISH